MFSILECTRLKKQAFFGASLSQVESEEFRAVQSEVDGDFARRKIGKRFAAEAFRLHHETLRQPAIHYDAIVNDEVWSLRSADLIA